MAANRCLAVNGDLEVCTRGNFALDKNRIYMDSNATTPICQEAINAMIDAMKNFPGNPSSQHTDGRRASCFLGRMRSELSGVIGAKAEQIIFTSGGTESNNCVIRNVMNLPMCQDKVILVGVLEHSSVLDTVINMRRNYRKNGYNTYYVFPCNTTGYYDLGSFKNMLQEHAAETALICIMMGQNEIGTIQPIVPCIKAARRICPEAFILVDATQCMGKYNISVASLGYPDFITASAHKFHGPRGMGFIYADNPAILRSGAYQTGGGQESQVRSGTEDLPAVAGMIAALLTAVRDPKKLKANQDKIRAMRDHVLQRLVEETRPGAFVINGDPKYGLYNTLSLTFNILPSIPLNMAQEYDKKNISVSSGSACSRGKPSHVLTALGKKRYECPRTIRISLDVNNTMEQCDIFVEATKKILAEVTNIEEAMQSSVRDYSCGSHQIPSRSPLSIEGI